ncbi:MAG: hypothetical protein J6N70_13740 [Oribacterium sp.]|nr:hypothetical protein [Oribacterium sp.]MBP3297891.1 hypothetical protein [Lachnospiraceae bacterium]
MALISKEKLIDHLARKKFDVEVMEGRTPGWNDLIAVVNDEEPVTITGEKSEIVDLVLQYFETVEMSWIEAEMLAKEILIEVQDAKAKALECLKFTTKVEE